MSEVENIFTRKLNGEKTQRVTKTKMAGNGENGSPGNLRKDKNSEGSEDRDR